MFSNEMFKFLQLKKCLYIAMGMFLYCLQPIRFISLPDSMHMHENMDDDFLVHQIVTYDYNNPAHDNVTCEMVVSPDENNIFELVHDGSFKHNCKCIRTMQRNTYPCKSRYQSVP